MKNFETINLSALLKRALSELNYVTPTSIQAQAIPPALAGNDILGCAETGTGKTAAFALPILNLIQTRQLNTSNKPTALVLAPTRELAVQIAKSFKDYGKHVKFRQTLVYGGVRQDDQVRSLRRGTNVIVATPGRLLDLIEQGYVDLRKIAVLVLDEADRMLDMGFLPDLKKIIGMLPKKRQSLFFSATLPPDIKRLSSKLLYNPVSINVTRKTNNVVRIEQTVRMVTTKAKLSALQDVLSDEDADRVIVFTRTKHGANSLAKKLDKTGIRTAAIHGNKTQNARQRALQSFRQHRVNVLVATDVAARGIDIDGVTHVVNYDMPDESESYVHRIGRTGRAGSEGIAISFCKSDELRKLRAVERLIGKRIRVENPEFQVVADAPSEPKRKRIRNRSRASNASKPNSRNESSGRSKFRRGNNNNRSNSQTTSRRRATVA